MTQVHYDDIALERLVHESHAVLVVRPADPASRTESIAILPEGSQFAGRNDPPYYEPPYHDPDPGPHLDRNYPPFHRVWQRYAVVERLKCVEGTQLGDVLEVADADTGSQESLHRDYYLHGRRKSPIYECYRGGAIADGADRIVFVQQRNGAWYFTVAWAAESIAARAEVEGYIAAGPPPNTIGLSPS